MKEKAYIAGVLHGDGYFTDKVFGLTAADKDFVQAFAEAVHVVFGVKGTVGPSSVYWRFERKHALHRFVGAKNFVPTTLEEKAMWLRGVFDSEGNAQLATNVGIRGYTHRRVSMYSTEKGTLERAASYLDDLGIKWRMRETKNSSSHKGDKVVFELALRGREDFVAFRDLVGSWLERKVKALAAIEESYLSDGEFRKIFLDARRRGGAKRKARTRNETLPAVVAGIRRLIDDGVKPTQRNCRVIPGYNTIQTRYPQAELIKMAEGL